MTAVNRIGRYRVIDLIGTGGFATVWKAHDEDLDSLVALKILSENWLDSADVCERFMAEARMLRKVDSDRVVRVYDIGELPDRRPYFVMTYADQGTLADRLSGGPLTWQAAVRAGIEVCAALRVLHEADVLHRDVKPSNVLFHTASDGQERVLLGDLGLAKRLSEASMITLTSGTPGYMAPEQYSPDGPLGRYTDVYGVGALLYRTITGQCPPGAVSDPDNEAVSHASLRTVAPEKLDVVVRRALAADPARRHSDIDSLLAELRAVLPASDEPPAAPPPSKPRGWRSARVRVIAALTVAAACIALVAWPAASVEVKDASGAITVSVPREWAVQVAGNAWDPAPLVGTADKQPAVLVSASASDYGEITDNRPGVFVGLLPPGTSLSADVFRSRTLRSGCRQEHPLDAGDVLAGVRQHCADVVIDDLLLVRAGREAWVQVKQPAAQADHTSDLLALVRIGAGDR
jgi:eukaryotic-like serine/threonine-protein kinase